MDILTQRLGDIETHDRWQEEWEKERRPWRSLTFGGIGVAGIGALTFVGSAGLLYVAPVEWDLDFAVVTQYIGLGIGAAGTATSLIGATQTIKLKRTLSNPSHRYTQEELAQKIDAYNRQLTQPTIHLELHPYIGPGTIGLTGIF
jgi:hypothetical protein